MLPDLRKATAYVQLAVGPVGWLRYQRALWIRTDGILVQHWLAVKILASELHATGTVRHARAQELLDRWMPVLGESLFQVLASAQNRPSATGRIPGAE